MELVAFLVLLGALALLLLLLVAVAFKPDSKPAKRIREIREIGWDTHCGVANVSDEFLSQVRNLSNGRRR